PSPSLASPASRRVGPCTRSAVSRSCSGVVQGGPEQRAQALRPAGEPTRSGAARARLSHRDHLVHRISISMKRGTKEGWSGRPDLNRRPQRPERCALNQLRYSPTHTLLYRERGNRGTREREEWQSGGRAVKRSRHLVKRGRGSAASDWRRAVAVVSERRVAEGRALYTKRSPAELYREARSSERERYARPRGPRK